jgi:hypothetical protein
MTGYILILTIVHASIGAVDTQRQTGFDSYDDCAAHGVAWFVSQRELYPDDVAVGWQCEAR